MSDAMSDLAGMSSRGGPAERRHDGTLSGVALQFLSLLAVWLVLSGRFERKYVIMGILSVALFTYLNRDLVHFRGHPAKAGRTNLRLRLATGWRLLAYLPWLLYSILMANLQVLWIVVHPRLPIDPRMLRFRTQHQSSIAQVVLANSITLTPGTITVDLVDGEYTVHAIMPASAESLLTAEMQNRVGAVFGEEVEEPPPARWTPELGVTAR